MRTTVDIPDDVLRAAKERAARRGESLSRMVERALRSHLDQSAESGEEPFELVAAGVPGGHFPSPSEVHRLLDADEWKKPS